MRGLHSSESPWRRACMVMRGAWPLSARLRALWRRGVAWVGVGAWPRSTLSCGAWLGGVACSLGGVACSYGRGLAQLKVSMGWCIWGRVLLLVGVACGYGGVA